MDFDFPFMRYSVKMLRQITAGLKRKKMTAQLPLKKNGIAIIRLPIDVIIVNARSETMDNIIELIIMQMHFVLKIDFVVNEENSNDSIVPFSRSSTKLEKAPKQAVNIGIRMNRRGQSN